ncbi:type II toxin-antitoxin system RelB family antitoxin [Streptococcus sp. ZJ93]|uniref:type II toxin-antitoxin system RelB family antitoxin n=1 Tax=Streptococcus handemini TaxID=3161188 RepID=UPI0032EB0FA4
MTTITLKVLEADKTFMQAMAKFEGVSLSELIRTKTLESLEDEYDARVADLSLAEYEEYLAQGGKGLSWDDL